MNIEYLARTNPKSCDPIAVRGSVASLTGEEIAAMLHGSHDGQFYLAMCLYAEQDHTRIVAHYLLSNHWNLYRKQQKLGRETLFKLTLLAVTEYIDPCRCVTCKGTKQIGDGVTEKIRDCPQCHGTGQSKLADDQKADYLGVSQYSKLKALYERIFTLLNHFDCDARAIFMHNGLDPDQEIA